MNEKKMYLVIGITNGQGTTSIYFSFFTLWKFLCDYSLERKNNNKQHKHTVEICNANNYQHITPTEIDPLDFDPSNYRNNVDRL